MMAEGRVDLLQMLLMVLGVMLVPISLPKEMLMTITWTLISMMGVRKMILM